MAANDHGIKVLVEPGKVRPKRKDIHIISFEEAERTSDPVRLYMKEMSRIPLLTRKEEIVLAKEIERGGEIVDIGRSSRTFPVTPPCVRVRTRRFGESSALRR